MFVFELWSEKSLRGESVADLRIITRLLAYFDILIYLFTDKKTRASASHKDFNLFIKRPASQTQSYLRDKRLGLVLFFQQLILLFLPRT